jgi:hypothetical protein
MPMHHASAIHTLLPTGCWVSMLERAQST